MVFNEVKRQFFANNDRSQLKSCISRWENEGYQGFYLSQSARKAGILLCAHSDAQGYLPAEYIFESLVNQYQSGLFIERYQDALFFVVFESGILHYSELVPSAMLEENGQAEGSDEESTNARQLQTLLINIDRLTHLPLTEQFVLLADNILVTPGTECIIEQNIVLPFTANAIVQVNSYLEQSPIEQLPALVGKNKLVIPRNSFKWLALLVAYCTMIIGLLWASKPDETIIHRIKVIDPYEPMIRVLTQSGINVKIKIVQLFEDLTRIRELSNWSLMSLTADVSTNVIKLTSANPAATTKQIKAFAQKYRYAFTEDDNGVTLARRVGHTPLMKTPLRMNINGQLRYISQALTRYWGANLNVESAKAVSNGLWNEKQLITSFSYMTVEDLDTIGTIVNGHPVSFESVQITPLASGYLEGKILMNLIGVVDNGKKAQ